MYHTPVTCQMALVAPVLADNNCVARQVFLLDSNCAVVEHKAVGRAVASASSVVVCPSFAVAASESGSEFEELAEVVEASAAASAG